MDDDEKFVLKFGCLTCAGILIMFFLMGAGIVYGAITIIDAIKA